MQISAGLPAFTIVGLPDKAVAESRERVRAALQAIGLALPPKRITVNLAPANVANEGSHFDLPIAIGLLTAMGVLADDDVAAFTVLGELALDGAVASVAGVLPAAINANAHARGLICPSVQGGEAAWASDIEVLAAPSLLALVNHFKGSQVLSPPEAALADDQAVDLDMRDIKGQETAKRALEGAAAGTHNLLMIGPPGAGKSMLAQRLPGLLPTMDAREALEVSMFHSVAGQLAGGRLMRRRPFRDPHHTTSVAAVISGGERARPGEVSLAHNGVLFLDELPEFARPALEALRQPLGAGWATIARANLHATYPTRVQLVAAMNPCRCGYLGNAGMECGRAPRCAVDLPGADFGPAVRPHRSPRRRAHGEPGGYEPAASGRGLGRNRRSGEPGARAPAGALPRPRDRAAGAHQRRSRRQASRRGGRA